MRWISKVPAGLWLGVIVLGLFVGGGVMGQLQQSGGSGTSVNVTNSTLAVTQSGNWSQRLQDGSGNSISSTGGALNVNLSSGSIANTAFAINAGTALIGTVSSSGTRPCSFISRGRTPGTCGSEALTSALKWEFRSLPDPVF